jgi:hypothetical protein
LLIAGFEWYRPALSAWVAADPASMQQRARLILALLGVLAAAPLVAFAIYLWSFGAKIIRAQEFPPPGLRVVRDTPVVAGARAVLRGKILKAVAIGCGCIAVVVGCVLWQLGAALSRAG